MVLGVLGVSPQLLNLLLIGTPAGLDSSSVLATVPFRSIRPVGSDVVLGLEVLQAVAAASFEDISDDIFPQGTSTRIQ